MFYSINSNIHLPGSTASIARQFIRCTLHQLAPNGIFKQLFYAHFTSELTVILNIDLVPNI